MPYSPGSNWAHTFVLKNAVGVQQDAQDTPNPGIRRASPGNGWISTGDGAVSNGVNPQGNGVYSCYGIIPAGYAVGDIVEIMLYYMMDGQMRNEIFHLGPLVSAQAVRQVNVTPRNPVIRPQS